MDDDIDRKRFYMSSTGPERKFELDRAELRRESETCLRLNEYYSYKPDDAGFMGIRYMDPDKLRAMADAEDAAGCTSVGGLAADLGQPIHGPDRRLEEKEKITGDLCAICGIGFLLPSLRCDHCNQKGGDAMSRDFEDGPPLSRKARTMAQLDRAELRKEAEGKLALNSDPSAGTIAFVGMLPEKVIALLDSLEAAEAACAGMSAELADYGKTVSRLRAENASLRAWRDQAVEAMESVNLIAHSEGLMPDAYACDYAALSACLAAAKEVGGG